MKDWKLIAIILLYSQFLSGQEINKAVLRQSPSKTNNFEINALLDSLSFFRLNPDLIKSNFDLLNADSAYKRPSESKRMQKLLGSYSDFKRKFLALNIKDNMPDLHLPKAKSGTPKLLDPDFIGSAAFLLHSPISFFYYNFSKEEQSQRKLYAINAYDPNRRYIDAKYNKDKVQLWTGLKDEELTKFVLFCNFDDSFLLNCSEYDLIDKVLKKLSDFKAIKNSGNFKN